MTGGGRGYDFGKYVKLREVKQLQSNTINNNIINTPKKEKISASSIVTINQFEESMIILRIRDDTYKKLQQHSRRYYNIETYDTIIENLLDNFEKHDQDKYWFNTMDR